MNRNIDMNSKDKSYKSYLSLLRIERCFQNVKNVFCICLNFHRLRILQLFSPIFAVRFFFSRAFSLFTCIRWQETIFKIKVSATCRFFVVFYLFMFSSKCSSLSIVVKNKTKFMRRAFARSRLSYTRKAAREQKPDGLEKDEYWIHDKI